MQSYKFPFIATHQHAPPFFRDSLFVMSSNRQEVYALGGEMVKVVC